MVEIELDRQENEMLCEKHTVEYIVHGTWARNGVFGHMYADIAQAAYASFLRENNELVPVPDLDEDSENYYAQQDRMLVSVIKAIVFSAMAAEAAVFDLGAIHLGDDYFTKHLDRLDLVAKWIVVPKLICGTSLDVNGPAIQNLRALVKARNALVHYKSRPLDSRPDAMKYGEKRSRQLTRNVHVAYECLVLISLELNSVLGVPMYVLPPFEASVESFGHVPDILGEVIDRCREVHEKHKAERGEAHGLPIR